MDKGQTQTSTTSLPSWENSAAQNILSQSNDQTSQDIGRVDYGGLNQTLGSDTNNILNNQVNTNSLANPELKMEGNSFTNPGTAQSFMNPYENTALASQVNLNEQTQLNPELAGIQQNAAASGALGGDRDQVLQGQAINQFNQNQQNVIAQGENTAYQAGQGQYNTQQQQQLAEQEAANQATLGGAASNVYANLAAGQNTQNQVAVSEAPGQQIATEAGVLGSLPKQGTTQTDTTPNGGIAGGIASGLLGGAGQLLMGLAEGGRVEFGSGLASGTNKIPDLPKKKKKAKKAKR